MRIFDVADGEARPIEYDPSLFDYGPTMFDPPLPHDLGFAGWRLHFHTNFPQDVAVFLGASYFRATDAGDQYGISCRGLAVDTGLDRPEEFPRFTRFWLVRPRPTDTTLTAYALLESESITGAYRFAHLARRRHHHGGHGPALPAQADRAAGHRTHDQHVLVRRERAARAADEWREEIHDSDGLSMWRGNGEWVWRPLTNPPCCRSPPSSTRIRAASACCSATATSPTTRTRRSATSGAPRSGSSRWAPGARAACCWARSRPRTRPSTISWPSGSPRRRSCPGAQLELAYRIHWAQRPPVQPTVAICVGTRIGRGGVTGFVQPNPEESAQVRGRLRRRRPAPDPQGRAGRARDHALARQGRAGDLAGRPVPRLALPAPAARDRRLALSPSTSPGKVPSRSTSGCSCASGRAR